MQTMLTKAFDVPGANSFALHGPNEQAQGEFMQNCQSFATYMQQYAVKQLPPDLKGAPMGDSAMGDSVIIAALEGRLPAGFKFKESVSGGGAIGCTLHKSMRGYPVSCDIPESTTISTECCDVLQKNGLSQGPSDPQERQALQQDAMTKCQSVMMWGQQQMGRVGPLPDVRQGYGGPEAALTYMSKALPAGMSCTEKTGSGMSGRMLNAILEMVEISGRSDMQELEAQPASSSLLPTIFVAGAAGALGGLVAFFALSKVSSKPQRVSLISDDA